MAQREAVVIILDVGASMSENNAKSISNLEAALKAVTLLVQQKILFGKNDEVGLVLFGTKETRNNLMEDGYKNIYVVKDIGPPDIGLLRTIERIEPGNEEGDLIDALIVGMDLLIKKQELDPKKKYQKRIFLVTNAGSPINKDDVHIVLQQFTKMEARLNIIGIDFDEDEEMDSEKQDTKSENERLLRKMASEVGGVIVPVNQALEMMSYFRSKAVLQRTTFRGLLEVGKHLAIPVWSFLKTYEQKFPQMTRISAVSQQSAQPGSMGVEIERTYHNINDPDTEIAADQRVKAFKYGKSLVPFTPEDEQALKYQAPACLKVIGFTSAKKVPRHHYMGTVECFVPTPGDASAASALSALIHALAETDSVAIVRYVKRNNSVPHLGFLTPHFKPDYECLYYCHLPFAEDIRQYPFAPLNPMRAKKTHVPTPEQTAATEALIKSLDLMGAARDDEGNHIEALKPKYTYNPVLQRFYQCVQHRALHPNTQLPKLDPLIEKYITPDQDLFQTAKPALQTFKELFPLAKSEESKEKNERIYWKDSLAANQIKLDSYVPDPSKKRKMEDEYAADFSMESLVSAGVSEVGSIKPVEDFKEMISRKDVDLVDKAIEDMKKRIKQLVNDSILNQLYPKAMDCLIALRAGCIQEEEPEVFNSFLKEIRGYYEGKRRDDFWQAIVEKGVTLIHFNECNDSTVSPEEAKQFLTAQPVSMDVGASKDDEVNDLFAMVE